MGVGVSEASLKRGDVLTLPPSACALGTRCLDFPAGQEHGVCVGESPAVSGDHGLCVACPPGSQVQ